MKFCSVDGCENTLYAKGVCNKHYLRLKHHNSLAGNPSRTHAPYEERFWRRVDKSGECWLWTGGSKTQRGYGLVQKAGKGSGYESAHRASFRMANGYLPEVVMHKCDNPPCVRPDHLVAGTYKANHDDMVAKGRRGMPRQVGEAHFKARLTERDVLAIRALEGTDRSASAIGRDYGVSHRAITAIWKRENWRHIA